jgi:hypothetical protein
MAWIEFISLRKEQVISVCVYSSRQRDTFIFKPQRVQKKNNGFTYIPSKRRKLLTQLDDVPSQSIGILNDSAMDV